MNLNINRKKAKVYAVLVSFLIVLGVFAIGLYKAVKFTNDHTIVFRSPIQTPWIISKKGEETAKLETTEQKIDWLVKEVQKHDANFQEIGATVEEVTRLKK